MPEIGTPLRTRRGSRSRRTVVASCLALGLLASLAPTAGAAVFTNPAPIEIPTTGSNAPATPYPSPIAVSGLTGTVTNVKVTLNGYSHDFLADTHVVLVPPAGTGQNILLMAGVGGNAEILPPGVNITFADGSPVMPAGNTAFPSGTYKPTARANNGVFPAPGPGNNFCSPGPNTAAAPSFIGGDCTLASALNGSAPNGTWSLYVIDIGAPDGGRIAGGWTLDITAGGPAVTPQQLTVTKAGTGTGGTVRGLGISCPSVTCTKAYNSGTSVVLTATGDAFNAFTGFTGCDSTTATTCTVNVNAARNVTATFNGLPRTVNVGKIGSGSGTVTGTGINCGADCSETYQVETSVVLTATPAAGSRFTGFIGCPSANANTCTINANSNKNVTARFTQNTVYPLPPTPPVTPRPPATLAGCAPGRNVITFGAGNDVRSGTPGNDLIFAGAGNDVIDGLSGDDCLDLGPGNDRGQGGTGNDLVLGGLGNDTVTGSDGNDRLSGDDGNDRIVGNVGNDQLFGGTAADRLFGGFGDDLLSGGSGNDSISGSRGKDRIDGGAGADRISAGSSADRVAGASGNDRINGDSSNDSLSGNSGRDRITGGAGRDRISGGSGGDSIAARDKQRDTINCGSGRDRVVADRTDRVSRNCERVSRR